MSSLNRGIIPGQSGLKSFQVQGEFISDKGQQTSGGETVCWNVLHAEPNLCLLYWPVLIVYRISTII